MTKKGIFAALAAGTSAATSVLIAENIARSALGGNRQTYEEAIRWQGEHSDISWFDGLEKEEYLISGFREYPLHALFCACPRETDRCVILTHGYTDNRYGCLKYMKLYLDLGFHCLIYDLRGHGRNAPANCTYGILESRDLLCVLADARKRFPQIKTFGLHGESLGSSTTLTALDRKPEVAFVVADCGFARIEPVLRGMVWRQHVLPVFVRLASPIAKRKCGYSFSRMHPVEHLKENRIPILFVHGTEDTLIPACHSKEMYETTKGVRELCLVPGASHAMSILTDPALYERTVRAFLGDLGIV